MSPVRCIALLGPRGAGKSTLGPLLARQLGFASEDGDRLLAARAGMSASDYLATAGQAAFRALEEEVTAAALAAADRLVVALGGGAVLAPAVQAGLRRPGVFPVLLLAPAAVLAERLRRAPRPPLTALGPEAEVALLLQDRLPIYRSLCRLELDTSSLDPESCVRAIVEAVSSAC